ncbi:type I-U CRISPR-associated protein Csb2 [Actinomyces oris]|uniref:type I-G CRISPR-associated protein Csb2 n=1 Tax=Actinomyces oris TaxID=544580 RepID=UPI0022FD4317|nr:type I-U CRISPR-associated protein Csb2 [Actinomyces oris]WCA43894.1 type I-U CRISPR-associated protein Csb2 [Actinomyces oris]
MSDLTITASFPLGEFNAHDGEGRAEWPPAPARVLAAMLSAAHGLGEGASEVEALFRCRPPRITAPPAGERQIGYRRWVPVNNELKMDKNGSPTGIVDLNERLLEKQAKDPECGMMVGTGPDDIVRWTFPVDGPADLGILQKVARSVEYLGRPTSPVLLDVVDGAGEVPPGHFCWEPDPLGWIQLRVGTEGLLAALDAREEERRRSTVTGTHPYISVRPTALYRLVDGRSGDGAAPDARELLRTCSLYRMPHSGRQGAVLVHASDAALVTEQLRDSLGEAGWMLPLIGGLGRRHLPVLRGVLVAGGSRLASVGLAVRTGVVEARLAETRTLASLPRVLRAATAPSSLWTTVVPTAEDPEHIVSLLEECASGLGCGLVGAERHSDSRSDGGIDVQEDNGRWHVSVTFDSEVPGPVVFDGALMVPLGAATLAVNPRRPRAD